MDTERFFPHTPGGARCSTVPTEIQSICDRCPVREECLQHALTNGELGVWGGTTEAQRRAILRRIRRAHCPACTGTQLLSTGLAQACAGCGTSWMATTRPARSRRPRPRLGVNRRYDHATRSRAVAMVLQPGPDGRRSIASVANTLGVNRESLRQWVLAARGDRQRVGAQAGPA